MAAKALHQFLAGATAGDAITAQALDIRRWLGEMGVVSHLFAHHVHESMAAEVRPLTAYRRSHEETAVIYHHSIGSEVVDFLPVPHLPLILVYHNVTPPDFFAHADPGWVRLARWGREQLAALRPLTRLGVAVSAYNEAELRAAGFTPTAVLPISLAEADYQLPNDPAIAGDLAQSSPNLLFVGRMAPNKKQEDLVKLLYFYARIRPQARLFLVGDRWTVGYDEWVMQLARDLGLGDRIILTGKVSQAQLVTFYRHADLYISMSEHEGFGKPLVESMLLGLPVLAFGATAVPDTMGNAGVLFFDKDFERLAELVEILITDERLRGRLVFRQKQRAALFLDTAVKDQFRQLLQEHFPDYA